MKFTPKDMILTAISGNLRKANCQKLLAIFTIDSDKYSISVSNSAGGKLNINISEKEINQVKKLFVNRIVSAWQMKYDIELKNVIIQVDVTEVDNEKIEIFVTDLKDEVLKFDY